jgi:hypothetical protein
MFKMRFLILSLCKFRVPSFFAFAVLAVMSGCKKGDNLSDAQAVSNANIQTTILGTWQDEDQLLLVDSDSRTLDPIVGFNLNLNQEVQKAAAANQAKIASWMVLKVKRIFTQNSYRMDANCVTMNGEKTDLSVSVPMVLNEKAFSFELTGDEKSHHARLGEFDCVASIAGHTTRKYAVSADGQQLTLILGNAPEDRIPLRRIAIGQRPAAAATPTSASDSTASQGITSMNLVPTQQTYLKKSPGVSVTGSTGLKDGVDYCRLSSEFRVGCIRVSSANEYYVSGVTGCSGITSGYLYRPHFSYQGPFSQSCP